ncbi:hypothetical protein GCM10022403_028750 [Streptomyces coacervatus]|uniref:Uncharacterized protein n=1 Tax=Streptomyces coacervatus TaxID=647381 RepID=A0ABP7HJ90_9ACTN
MLTGVAALACPIAPRLNAATKPSTAARTLPGPGLGPGLDPGKRLLSRCCVIAAPNRHTGAVGYSAAMGDKESILKCMKVAAPA